MALQKLWNTAKYGLFMSVVLSLWGCGPRVEGAVCGNGIVEVPEDCDDGNTTNQDACPQNCAQGIESGEAACADNTDNDLDSLVDCADSDCDNTIVCDGGGNEANCNDCQDEDGDGFFDCEDIDCAADPLCTGGAPAEDSCAGCTDGRDNDGNGFVDCLDFACGQNSTTPDITNVCPVENDEVTCNNGIDDDDDGFTDCDDFSCGGATVCGGAPENNDAACSDGISNDGDNFIDCADFDCSQNPNVTVCNGTPEDNNTACTDGIDNDFNGFIDCADFGCSQNPNVTVCVGGVVQIQQIQGPATDAGHIADGAGATVEQVFVTAVRKDANNTLRVWVQEPDGETTPEHVYPEFAGILVFANATVGATITTPAVGDCVSIDGVVDEFQGLTELVVANAAGFTVAQNCGTAPTPTVVNLADIATDIDAVTAGDQPGPKAENFESVLVTVQNVTIAVIDQFGEFRLAAQGVNGINLSTDDFLFLVTPVLNNTFTSFSGVIDFAFNHFRLLPRNAADVVQ
jgi:hypothetical protein